MTPTTPLLHAALAALLLLPACDRPSEKQREAMTYTDPATGQQGTTITQAAYEDEQRTNDPGEPLESLVDEVMKAAGTRYFPLFLTFAPWALPDTDTYLPDPATQRRLNILAGGNPFAEPGFTTDRPISTSEQVERYLRVKDVTPPQYRILSYLGITAVNDLGGGRTEVKVKTYFCDIRTEIRRLRTLWDAGTSAADLQAEMASFYRDYTYNQPAPGTPSCHKPPRSIETLHFERHREMTYVNVQTSPLFQKLNPYAVLASEQLLKGKLPPCWTNRTDCAYDWVPPPIEPDFTPRERGIDW